MKREAAMGSSEKWYWENRTRQHEEREHLKVCLSEISEMDAGEYKAFLLRLWQEKGLTASDLVRIRAEIYCDEQSNPVPEVRDEDFMEEIIDE